jgi:hypothetical protein
MAFIVDIGRADKNNKSGAEFTGVYVKITNPQYDIENNQIILEVDIYDDETHRNTVNGKPLHSFILIVPISGLTLDNITIVTTLKDAIKTQIYSYLKASVSTFSGAVDV